MSDETVARECASAPEDGESAPARSSSAAVPSVISETISEKATRGRPRRYHPDTVAFVVESLGGLTPRAAQNKIHLARAAGVLEPASTEHPELRWLLDRQQGTFRATIVAELGRVRGDDAMIFLAREVSRAKVSSRAAVAYIRRERRRLEDRPLPAASSKALALALLTAADEYRWRHPDLTHGQVREALKRLSFALVPEAAE
jgi:hypothetical protein